MAVVSVLLGAAVEVGVGSKPIFAKLKVHLYFSTMWTKLYIYTHVRHFHVEASLDTTYFDQLRKKNS